MATETNCYNCKLGTQALLMYLFVIVIATLRVVSQDRPNEKRITSRELFDMLHRGVSNERICSLVLRNGIAFESTPLIERQLRLEGANDKILEAVLALTISAHESMTDPTDQVGLIDEYKRLVLISPGNAKYRLSYAQALMNMERDTEAKTELQAALKIDPKLLRAQVLLDAQMHFERGKKLSKAGSSVEAISEFRQSVALQPNSFRGHVKLAEAIGDSLRGDESITVMKKTFSHRGMGKLVETPPGSSPLDEEIREYSIAAQIKPKDPSVHSSLAAAFLQKRAVDSALRECEAAVRLAPNDGEPHFIYGTALLAANREAEAVKELKRAVELNPDLVIAHLNLGAVLLGMGDTEGAIVEFKRVQQLSPNNQTVYANLATALDKKGEHQQAIDVIRAARERFPQNVAIHETYERLVKK